MESELAMATATVTATSLFLVLRLGAASGVLGLTAALSRVKSDSCILADSMPNSARRAAWVFMFAKIFCFHACGSVLSKLCGVLLLVVILSFRRPLRLDITAPHALKAMKIGALEAFC